MSSESVGWAFRYSPYRGATFAVHVAIADSVNDQNDNEFWMRQGQLARKARTTRQTVNAALATMIDDGLLVLLEEGVGGANRYRFEMPPTPDVFGPAQRREGVKRADTSGRRRGVKPGDTPVVGADSGGVVPGDTQPKGRSNPREPKVDTSPVGDVAPEIEALCVHLADAIERHRDGDRPVVTTAWRKAMRLLVERGPLHVDKPEPQPAEKVRASIDAVFADLAVPDGRTGFCWADQIRSAGALRDHWVQLREAYRRTTGSRVGRGAQAVDRAAARLARDGASSREPLGLLVEHEPKEITA